MVGNGTKRTRTRKTFSWLAIAGWMLLAVLGGGASAAAEREPSPAESGAVVFVYSRFGESRYPNQNISLDQFETHLQELIAGGYTVLPLGEIVEAIRGSRPLPDRTVALTIDEAWRSVYEEAFPRLKMAGFPFTVFVSPGALDRGSPLHVTWGELKEMVRSGGVTVGMLPGSPKALPERHLNDIRADLRESQERLKSELGILPTLTAYPYGIYSQAIRDAVARLEGNLGLRGAFGQQSGVVYSLSDPYALPRFVMNEGYGSLERFRLAANALPLPVEDVTPGDPMLSTNPPSLGFSVVGEVGDLARLACFAGGLGRLPVERLDEHRLEVRIPDRFPPGRARINCTLPAPDGRWRWHGVQLFVPEVQDPPP